MRTYEISPRPVELGGGWNAKVFEDGEEIAGGAFPVCPEAPTEELAHAEAMEWAEGMIN